MDSFEIQDIREKWEPMLEIPLQQRPALSLEINNGLTINHVCLVDIHWYEDNDTPYGACCSLAAVANPTMTIIEGLDFDDIYEMRIMNVPR